MEHLKIIQTTEGNAEEVSMDIVQKLYDVATNSTLDNTSDLQGKLRLTVGYREPIDWLTTHFSNLQISADNYAIPFEDPNMLAYLNSIGVGSNGMVTEAQAAAATVVANSQNTTVRKFNELKYFTNITSSRGGWDYASSGDIRFSGWTALEEIDISNFTSIGNVTYGSDDSFSGCSNLRQVKASNKLTKIGVNAFSQCKKLESITGLSGSILVKNAAFNQCEKLTTLGDCSVNLSGQNSVFNGCKSLTSVVLDNNTTSIGYYCFSSCLALNSINFPSGVTSVGASAFRDCSSLTIDASNLSNIKTFYNDTFRGSKITGTLTLSGNVSMGSSCFDRTNISSVDLSATTLEDVSWGCFSDCANIISVSLPTTMTHIRGESFMRDSALTTVNFSSLTSLTRLGENAFRSCGNLTATSSDIQNIEIFDACCLRDTNISGDLVLPNITSIDNEAFWGTKITSCDFTGSTFTKLSTQVFRYCSSLDHLIVNASVTQLGEEIVANCNNLRYIKFLGTTVPTQQSNNSFGGMNNNVKIYVPDAALSDYQSASGWSNYSNRIFPMSQFATDFPNG